MEGGGALRCIKQDNTGGIGGWLTGGPREDTWRTEVDTGVVRLTVFSAQIWGRRVQPKILVRLRHCLGLCSLFTRKEMDIRDALLLDVHIGSCLCTT
jgi:hypothetical protein